MKNIVLQMKPSLDKGLDSSVFRIYYYLKEELMDFCRKNSLQTSGSKMELTERIAHYLDTGEKIITGRKHQKANAAGAISLNGVIEPDFVCSEKHRAFFKEQIGASFSFNVMFQKWLKSNGGKTYREAISAYRQIIVAKKEKETVIDRQFEYNSYIRDFFRENKGKSLADAIHCWNYKKSLQGHHRYENSDLTVLDFP